MDGVTLNVGLVVPAFFYVPYWAAHDLGLYGKQGLNVRFVVFGGIDPLTKALKDGTIDVGIGSPEHVIHDVEAGGDLRMIAGNVNRLTHSLIAQPEIKRLEDLRGKTIGVSALSAGTSSLFTDILERVGLHPGDYHVVEAGVVPPRHERLLERSIDAAMQTDPHNYLAEDAGFTNLGPVSGWIPYFQFTSVNVTRTWAGDNEDALVRFLAASIQGSQWMFKNQQSAVEVAARRMDVDPKYLERAWKDHVDGLAVPIDLRLEARSIGTALDMIRRDRTTSVLVAGDAGFAKYVDTRFLRAAQGLAGVDEALVV
ncbi:ABC transporter substrate-binding protein [Burkholderia sp. S171]|uniref:ABC transporter substrate-binding protein n=1 Tax=Burkholderia sp. S171 TaxID=1641860 RepID=UPI00131A6C59|nr:ABC transporter substrate-binding protein [Burkholderia sp. S171]